MRSAPAHRLCHLCGHQADALPPVDIYYVLDATCPRCLMPYLPPRPVDAAEVESVLLALCAIPTADGFWCPAIRILCHIARTRDDVEQFRHELHGIDVAALVIRTRETRRTSRDPEPVRDREVRLLQMARDAETGLLRWRIDHLCRTACTAIEARSSHHRRILEGTP